LIKVVLPAPFSPTSASFSDRKREILDGPFLAPRILEPHAPELDALLRILGGALSLVEHGHLGLELEEREQVLEEQPVLVEAVHVVEQPLERALALVEQRQIQRHRAERDAARQRDEQDPDVGAVVARRRDEAPQQALEGAAARELRVLLEDPPEDLRVPREQRLAQAEQLDLLDRRVEGQQLLHVGHAARLGRAPRLEPEVELAVAALHDERGDRRAEEDQRDPRIEREQESEEREQRQRVLREQEAAVDERHHAELGLPPGVLHLVVEFRILEEARLERERLADDARVDEMAEAVADELVRELPQLPVDRASEQQAELDEHVGEHGHQAVARREAQAERGQYAVDDELRDPRLRDGQDRADEGDGAEPYRAARIGLPQKRERARRVLERGEKVLEARAPADGLLGLGLHFVSWLSAKASTP
jgi:hypothetical protein